ALIFESVPLSLRGELTRWLLEPMPGVFVGAISDLTRDKLWDKVSKGVHDEGCMMAYDTNNEQGYAFRFHGNVKRQLKEFEGLFLIGNPMER
ncbi:MAG TPA: type I-E CRISPR-associated endoribonuclease Cas2e, partial [Bacillota bacterium]|nr:type I-E CRISPR-associated endoribonuclease Cas2e [Bacillota bacterium]